MEVSRELKTRQSFELSTMRCTVNMLQVTNAVYLLSTKEYESRERSKNGATNFLIRTEKKYIRKVFLIFKYNLHPQSDILIQSGVFMLRVSPYGRTSSRPF